ncbi:MAG: DNA polymerase III subunit beta [Planctomycetes bacterium]|nr:DNA polymerase III subunit beta [Planctomycetota bacterium]
MKFITKPVLLANAFQLVGGVIPANSPRPALNNIRLETKGGGVELIGTDTEVALRSLIRDVRVEQEGVVSIPPSNLALIMRETRDEEVVFQAEGNVCEIRSPRSRYRIQGDDPHNFPFVPFIESGKSMEFQVGDFLESIRRTIFATAKEKARFALNGVLLEMSGQDFQMVATDGKRLSMVSKTLEQKVEGKIFAIVPRKAMELFERIAAGREQEKLLLDVQEALIQFRVSDVTLSAKLVEGNFPNYREVIPKEYPIRLELPAAPFHSDLQKAAYMASDTSRVVYIGFKKGMLTFKSSNEGVAEAELEMPVEYDNKELVLGFNPEYLADILKVLASGTFRMEFAEVNRPVLVRADEGYLNLIMPITPTA